MKKIFYILAAIAMFFLFGIAGNYDFAEQVLCSVPEEVYLQIKKDMGGNPSEVEIARYFLDNQEKYE